MGRAKELSIKGHSLTEVSPGIWRLEPKGKMRVGVHFVGTHKIFEALGEDRSFDQAMNVACLPGVMDPVLTMPDLHQGYGFPIGGVAAFHEKTGIVSPGGVGYDINCGVRLLKTSLVKEQLGKLTTLVSDLFDAIPAGVGKQRADLSLTPTALEEVLVKGSRWAIEEGFGEEGDLRSTEETGRIAGADPDKVSARAKERGQFQMGTLGSGNHFVEVQFVDEIYDEATAQEFGLSKDQILVTIHTGSRGLGYQVCADYLESSIAASAKYGIELPDRELASAPLDSPEGKAYLGAMSAAANFAFANRQVITHWVREIFKSTFGIKEMPLLYDVCHNIAKFEELPVAGKRRRVCIHRKGATRAYPGQPILVPGDMGRYSYILVGKKESLENSFGSACHGAGRELSRAQAKKRGRGRAMARELEDQGIWVKTAGRHTLVEEMPEAYKDVSEVAEATVTANLAKAVARVRPLAVVKG